MPSMLRTPCIIAAVALLALSACAEARDPLAGLDEQERQAVDRITRDPAVRLWRSFHRDDGTLVVWTRQGDVSVRYHVGPTTDADGALRISRIPDGMLFPPARQQGRAPGTSTPRQP